jgi:hypothetical protein
MRVCLLLEPNPPDICSSENFSNRSCGDKLDISYALHFPRVRFGEIERMRQNCYAQPTFPVFRRGRKIAKNDYYLRHVCMSAWNNSASSGRIFYEI